MADGTQALLERATLAATLLRASTAGPSFVDFAAVDGPESAIERQRQSLAGVQRELLKVR